MRDILFVASDKRILLYNIREKRPLKYILDCQMTHMAVLNTNYDKLSFAHLVENKKFRVGNLRTLQNECLQIEIHDDVYKNNHISKLSLNYDGNKIACAHQGGTIINIYDTMMNAGKELFRLKIKNTCNIETMEFSKDSKIFIAITSPFKYNKVDVNSDT